MDIDLIHKLVTVFHGTLNHPHFKHIHDWAHDELVKMKIEREEGAEVEPEPEPNPSPRPAFRRTLGEASNGE